MSIEALDNLFKSLWLKKNTHIIVTNTYAYLPVHVHLGRNINMTNFITKQIWKMFLKMLLCTVKLYIRKLGCKIIFMPFIFILIHGYFVCFF